jgi:hypothetical protein
MPAATKAMQSVGTSIFIATGAAATNDAAGFAAVTGWKEILEVDEIPEYGPETDTVTRAPLKTGVKDKQKGMTDYGSIDLTGGWAPGDQGQAQLITSSAPSAGAVSMKIVMPDGAIDYFTALIMGYKKTPGASGDFVKFKSKIEIKNAIVSVAAP